MKITATVPATPSNFALWRCAIALAHIDHRLSNSETDLIYEYSKAYEFSDEQRRQLEQDLQRGIDFNEAWPAITDKRDRAHLINFSRVLFHVDGHFSAEEEKIWQEMCDKHMLTIDYKAAIRDARAAEAQYDFSEKALRKAEGNQQSWALNAFEYLAQPFGAGSAEA